MTESEHTDIQLETFKEQVQAGMHQAAEMLSKFLQPGFAFRIENQGEKDVFLPDGEGTDEEVRVGICLKIDGAVTGLILLLFSTESACKLAGMLLRQPPPLDVESSAVHSTLNEVGNIFASGILFCLDDSLKLRAMPSPPTFLSGTGEQIQEQCQNCCDQPGEMLEQVLLSCYSPEGEQFSGTVVFKITEKTLQQFQSAGTDSITTS